MIFPDKRETLTAYLQEGECRLLIDATQLGVDVPERHRQRDLVLKISFRYSPPDLQLHEWGISITLSFDGDLHKVKIPWAALYAVRSWNGQVYVWPEPKAAPVVTKRRGGLGLVQ